MVSCTSESDPARVGFDRHAQGTPERLEHGFDNMMRIRAADHIDVHRHHRVIDETLEKFVEQVDVEIPDPCARKTHVIFEPGTTGQIEHDA